MESITSQNLGSCNFWQIINSNLSNNKFTVSPLFHLEVLSSSSNIAIYFLLILIRLQATQVLTTSTRHGVTMKKEKGGDKHIGKLIRKNPKKKGPYINSILRPFKSYSKGNHSAGN